MQLVVFSASTFVTSDLVQVQVQMKPEGVQDYTGVFQLDHTFPSRLFEEHPASWLRAVRCKPCLGVCVCLQCCLQAHRPAAE
jgi:hypothetical protein